MLEAKINKKKLVKNIYVLGTMLKKTIKNISLIHCPVIVINVTTDENYNTIQAKYCCCFSNAN